MSEKNPKQPASFEAAMQQLEEILKRMQDDSVSLDESITLYARAAELIGTCHERLEKAKVQLREIDDRIALPEDEL